MQAYAAMDPRLPLAAVPAYARRIEQLGFDGLHVPETIHDSLAVALLALEHTTRLTVRTAVTLAFVRSPTLVAYTAWDLSTMSGGRFELGLGTQIKQNIEGRFGVPWSEPRSRMAEYLAALDALFTAFRDGGPLHYEGDHYRLTRMQPYFNPGPSATRTPPVWLGAVNAGMCELAGRMAHGVITHSTNADPDYLRAVVLPALDRGATDAGRPTRPMLLASPPIAMGANDDSVRQERERQRRMLAFLYSTPSYAPTLGRRGWTELPEQLRVMIRAQRWADLPGLITDAMLDELVICGRYEQLPALLTERYSAVADGVVLPPLGEGHDDRLLQKCVTALRRTPTENET
ncbi:TIGR03617 family F420-dependent LLM class oxidoreductase [Nocardia sp. 004]|uniref:TIGR03617 family F420-dependent LLM class oxidoreductase n=1 Tax=Nocardia sp. 004 TaxID=3385978 RepID=UPI0039A05001